MLLVKPGGTCDKIIKLDFLLIFFVTFLISFFIKLELLLFNELVGVSFEIKIKSHFES